MKNFKFLVLLLVGFSMTYIGCTDDGGSIASVTLSTVTATGTDLSTGSSTTLDLNGASSATDVPTDAVFSIGFSKDVDGTTATPNISLNDGTADVSITTATSGSSITVTPNAELARGTIYTMSVKGGLLATDGGTFVATSRTFTSAGNVEVQPPRGTDQKAYWKFDGDATSTVGSYTGTAIGVAFQEDRFGFEESAAYFDGDVSLVEVPNGADLITPSATYSFWMKLDTADHLNENGDNLAGHFVMGIGAFYGLMIEISGPGSTIKLAARYEKNDGTTESNDFFINADGQTRDNGGWIGVEFEKEITGGLASVFPGKWVHVIFTYDGSTNKRSLFLNGELIERDDLTMPSGTMNFKGFKFDPSTSGETIGTGLAFGFGYDRQTTLWNMTGFGNYNSATSNHFKGWLDDIRFFSAAYTDSDALTLYNAEK